MRIVLILIVLIINSGHASTNFGTLKTIKNGLATVNECYSGDDSDYNCSNNLLDTHLIGILPFASVNMCVANDVSAQKNNIEIPNCPRGNEMVQGLDNTYPSGGMFVLYSGDNDSFIHELFTNYKKNNQIGRFNLVLPQTNIENLKKNKKLSELLNSNQVNIIPVKTTPSVNRWMRDSFQMGMVDGKPGIIQLNHFRETYKSLDQRLACEIANQCGIPYYVPEDVVVGNMLKEAGTLDSGGNLDVLPGGTFYTGVGKSKGRLHSPQGDSTVHRTKQQEILSDSLSKDGKKILELDGVFLRVGHVDEMVNVVKTNRPKPCDYALLLASPRKAVELIENHLQSIKPIQLPQQGFFNSLFSINVYADVPITCTKKSDIKNKFGNSIVSQDDIAKIYSENCISNTPLAQFVESDTFSIIKRDNLEGNGHPDSIDNIIQSNKKILIEELAKTTGCSNPVVIDVPVLFRSGRSITPDLVNGFIDTPDANSASNALLPRSYFKPFDDYVMKELTGYGVNVSLIHDMEYHLLDGEVHCGTNEMRICK